MKSDIATDQIHHPLLLTHRDNVSHSVYVRSRVTVTDHPVAFVCSEENADQFLYILAYHCVQNATAHIVTATV